MRINNRLECLENKYANLLTDYHDMEDMGNFILHILNPDKGVEHNNVLENFETILIGNYPKVNLSTFYEMYKVDLEAFKLSRQNT